MRKTELGRGREEKIVCKSKMSIGKKVHELGVKIHWRNKKYVRVDNSVLISF